MWILEFDDIVYWWMLVEQWLRLVCLLELIEMR